MKNPKIEFANNYPRQYLEYLDETNILRYNDAVKIYPRDGGTRHAVPVFSKEL